MKIAYVFSPKDNTKQGDIENDIVLIAADYEEAISKWRKFVETYTTSRDDPNPTWPDNDWMPAKIEEVGPIFFGGASEVVDAGSDAYETVFDDETGKSHSCVFAASSAKDAIDAFCNTFPDDAYLMSVGVIGVFG